MSNSERKSNLFNVDLEIQKYTQKNMHTTQQLHPSDLSQMVQSVEGILQRIKKDQIKQTGKLEHAVDLLEEQQEDTQREYRVKLKKAEEENETLLSALLSIADAFENLYRYIYKSQNDQWKEQILLLWKQMGDIFLSYGIIRIEGESFLYSVRMHTAIKVVAQQEIPTGVIVEVLKSGYMYKDHIIRKASVIVNQVNGKDGVNE